MIRSALALASSANIQEKTTTDVAEKVNQPWSNQATRRQFVIWELKCTSCVGAPRILLVPGLPGLIGFDGLYSKAASSWNSVFRNPKCKKIDKIMPASLAEQYRMVPVAKAGPVKLFVYAPMNSTQSKDRRGGGRVEVVFWSLPRF
jgi:hypothetical protein